VYPEAHIEHPPVTMFIERQVWSKLAFLSQMQSAKHRAGRMRQKRRAFMIQITC